QGDYAPQVAGGGQEAMIPPRDVGKGFAGKVEFEGEEGGLKGVVEVFDIVVVEPFHRRLQGQLLLVRLAEDGLEGGELQGRVGFLTSGADDEAEESGMFVIPEVVVKIAAGGAA